MTNATGTPATTTGTPTGNTTGGVWVSVVEAGRVLGLSERSVRRAISSGRLVSAIQDGRRVIRIEGEPDATTGGAADRHPTGGGLVELKPDATGGPSGGGLAVRQAIEQIVTHQAEQFRVDLGRARRAAAWGWSLTAAAGILLAVGTVWGVRAVEQARGQAATAEASRAILADDLARERGRADELAGELRAERRQAEQQRVERIERAIVGAVEMLDGCP